MAEEPKVTHRLLVRRIGTDEIDLVHEACDVFDSPPHPEAVRAFLADKENYLFIGYVDGCPAGIIRAHLLRRLYNPRPQMFLYELGVHERFRKLGLGVMLVREIADLCRREGFLEMFVLTSADNESAMRTYASAGGTPIPAPEHVMFEWSWPARNLLNDDV